MNMIDRLVKLASDLDEGLSRKLLLSSIRRGLTCMIPIILAGSIATVIVSFPIAAYQKAMSSLFGETWKSIFQYIQDGSFSILSPIITICISYSYSSEMIHKKKLNTSPIIVSVVSLCSYIALSGVSKNSFTFSSFGSSGIFLAMLAAAASSAIFLRLTGIGRKKTRVFTDGADTLYSNAIASILPAAATLLLFAAVNLAVSSLLKTANLQDYFSNTLLRLFSGIGSPFLKAILFIFGVHALWFFGMHGNDILQPVAQSIISPGPVVNHALVSQGISSGIFTKTFFDSFVFMGGCGAAICLILAVILVGRYKNQKKLIKLSIVPVIFNVNELILFGIPIVLNPIYLVPFLLVPVLLTVVAYAAVSWGLVPYPGAVAEWTTPVLLSGYVATGSISGSALQLVNIALGTLCYMPFVMLSDAVTERRNEVNLHKVYAARQADEQRGLPSTLLSRTDEVGSISRMLAADLEHDLIKGRIHLFYQPQHDYAGNLIGVEALLRWKHASYGYIYPPLTIALAEESGMIDRIGLWIFRQACMGLKSMKNVGHSAFTMSVNVSAMQLENDQFAGDLKKIVDEFDIDPAFINIEITEHLALSGNDKIREQIMEIRKLGFPLAMDDFGMGHSSLVTMQEHSFGIVKLDGTLVREILSNANSREIISSIVNLGKTMNYSVIAEYVESMEQVHVLHSLGCDCYQGYYFSRAIPLEEMKEYMRRKAGGK